MINGEKPVPSRRVVFFEWPYRLIVIFGCFCPLFAMFVCLWVSDYLHYDQVRNSSWCPETEFQTASISKTIGVHAPQRFIWILLISLHFPTRLFCGSVYSEFYLSSTYGAKNKWFPTVAGGLKWVQIVETLGLLNLSVVDVAFSFSFHAFSFAIWLFCQFLYQAANVFLHHCSGYNVSKKSQLLFWVKLSVFILISLMALSTAVTYPIYMTKCEVWANTMFCLVEYSIVVLNIGFHFMAYFEFPRLRVGLYGDFSHVNLNGTESGIFPRLRDQKENGKQFLIG